MTDRELLEYAAKAAGIALKWCDKIDTGYLDTFIEPHPRPHWVKAEWPHDKWNPLTDDGNAFRLAVKLGIVIDPRSQLKAASCKKGSFCEHEAHSDPYAATRRAIVRAAAEIGKGLKPFPSADDIRENWT